MATVLNFPKKFGGVEVLPPPGVRPKVGLYPLGSEDVVVSTYLFQIICAGLCRGTAPERLALAEALADAFRVPF